SALYTLQIGSRNRDGRGAASLPSLLPVRDLQPSQTYVKENSKMKRFAIVSIALTFLLVILGTFANAQDSPTLTVNNQAGSPASVRVVGPTSGYLDVPASSSR